MTTPRRQDETERSATGERDDRMPSLGDAALELDELLRAAVASGAAELHLRPMRPPLVSRGESLEPVDALPIGPEELDRTVRSILPRPQAERLDERRRVEFGYSVPGVSRFRCTVYHQRGSLVARFRRLPFGLPSWDEIGLPEGLRDLARKESGLVVVWGGEGSGVSTVIAALIREIVANRPVHAMTAEQPICYPLRDARGTVTQQEVGSDTRGFADAIDNALSEGADVLVADGASDEENLEPLLHAASDGKLVIVGLRTDSAAAAASRLLPADEPAMRDAVATQLAAMIGLLRVEREDDTAERALAVEIVRAGRELSGAIETGELARLPLLAHEADPASGMQSLEASLASLVVNGLVDRDVGRGAAPSPERFDAAVESLRSLGIVDAGTHDTGPVGSPGDFLRLGRLADAQSELDELRELRARERAADEKRIAALEEELEALSRRSAELEHLVERAGRDREQIMEAVERESRRFEDEENALRCRLEKAEARAAEAEEAADERQGLTSRVSELESELAAARSDAQSAARDAANREDDARILGERVAELERRLEAAEAESGAAAVAEAETRTLRDRVADLESRLGRASKLAREASRHADEAERAQSRLRELESRLEEREAGVAEQARRLAIIERERDRTIAMVEEHCREYERRIARLREKLLARGIDPFE